MLLYHGTNIFAAMKIMYSGIDLKIGRKYLDFGQGFYVTPDFRQAMDWAGNNTTPCIVSFELDAKSLNVKRFDRPDEEWATFVVENRLRMNPFNKYDCVFGPMADSRIASLYRRYQTGKTTKEQAIRDLIGKSNGYQVAILSEKSCKAMNILGKGSLE